ncbi:MAG: transcription termination/antitermination protein NusA [Chloroflexi bacterium]|nr:transcription termination/antitermination protein NusA [Chloroflexota bacterium]
MNKQLLMAINQICAERNLRPQVVIEAVEQALVSAYRRNFGNAGNVEAKLNPETGDMHIYARMEVVPVNELEDPETQISPEAAAEIDPEHANPGDIILIEKTPREFGRIAAQTAKQVVLQRIREAERDSIYEEYAAREGELIQGVVRSIDFSNNSLVVSLDGGRAEGIMTRSDQIPGERYRPNSSILAYVSEVSRGNRGAVIHLSRTHRNMLRRLLEKEVPEIKQGTVEIKAIAREAGSRSKVAVAATQPGVDPVGSCVGMRGVRIQNIVNELNGEKIDVIEWHPDGERFVANALSPARVTDVLLFPEHDKTAMVVVPDNQLSLAIGKEGQNARLVAKLTGWRIDIKSETEAAAEGMDEIERQRIRLERKQRAQSDDLLEAARRILEAESETLPEVSPDLLEPEAIFDKLDEIDRPIFDEALAEVVQKEKALTEEVLPATEPEGEPVLSLDDIAKEAAEEIRKEEEAPSFDLASALSDAMTGFGQPEKAPSFDEELYRQFFKDEEEEEKDSKPTKKKKKKRRKDRRLVYDEDQGRVIAVKRRKRDRDDILGIPDDLD